jgi:hypothetical protein
VYGFLVLERDMAKKKSAKVRVMVKKSRRAVALETRKAGLQNKNTPVPASIFWPDRIDHVKAIAMRGLDDDEMAFMMGVTPELLESWKSYYPSFAEAIEEGRTQADAQVVAALHSNAVGYEYETDEVVKTRRGAQVLRVTKRVPGETAAQKFWLQNRQPKHWNTAAAVNLGGQKGNPIQVDVETKQQVIHSILNLIHPRPDST